MFVMAFDKVIYIKLMIICNGIWRGHLYLVSNSICQLWVRWKSILWKFLRTYMLFIQRWKWCWVASKCFSCNLEILKEKYWYLKFIVNFKNWFRRYLSIISFLFFRLFLKLIFTGHLDRPWFMTLAWNLFWAERCR